MNKYLYFIPLFVSTSLISSCSQMNSIERKTYNSWEQDIGYTQVVKVGHDVYISGLTSEADTFDGQLTGIYETLQIILNDYGVDSTSVIKETIYTRDIEALKNAIPLRKQFFKEDKFPAATWVQVDRLYLKEHLLEIEFVVHIP